MSESELLFSQENTEGDGGMDDFERLRAERDFWRHLFDQLVEEFPESVVVVNDDGTITHWNDPIVELIGATRAEAVGNQAIDIVGTEGVEETLAEKSLGRENRSGRIEFGRGKPTARAGTFERRVFRC